MNKFIYKMKFWKLINKINIIKLIKKIQINNIIHCNKKVNKLFQIKIMKFLKMKYKSKKNFHKININFHFIFNIKI